MGEIARWSTTAGNNTFASPFGAQGSYAVSTVDDFERQIMASLKESYTDGEWLDYDSTYIPAFVDTITFTIPTNVTTLLTPYRKIKLYGSSFGTHCGVVLTSSFSSPNTTITVKMDEGVALTADISYMLVSIHSAIIPETTHNPSGASVPYLYGGQALSTWVTAPKNLIIGGAFDLNPWRRQVSFPATANLTQTAEGFAWAQTGGGVVSITKDASSPSIGQLGTYGTSCLKVAVTTADNSLAATDLYELRYRVEGYDALAINHGIWTLGFCVKATKTGLNSVRFASGGFDISLVSQYIIHAANTWEYKLITLPVSVAPGTGSWNYTNGIGLEIAWALAAGTNFQTTVGTWNAGSFFAGASQVNNMDTIGNTFSIERVSLIKGSGIYDWAPESIADTIVRANRNYYTTYPAGVYPGTASATVNAVTGVATGGGLNALIPFSIPVTQRITGTIASYSPTTGASTVIRDVTAGSDVSAQATFGGPDRVLISSVSTAITQGHLMSAHLTVEAAL